MNKRMKAPKGRETLHYQAWERINKAMSDAEDAALLASIAAELAELESKNAG